MREEIEAVIKDLEKMRDDSEWKGSLPMVDRSSQCFGQFVAWEYAVNLLKGVLISADNQSGRIPTDTE